MLDKIKILVVDDMKDIAELLSSWLKDNGARAKSISDPIKALNHLKKNKYDVVISDIQMPKMNGFQLGKSIKSLGIKVKLVYLSGYNLSPKDGLLAAQIGACDYLVKPIDAGELAVAISRAHETGRFLCDRHNASPEIDQEQILHLAKFLQSDPNNQDAVKIGLDLERLSKKKNKTALGSYIGMLNPYISTTIKEVVKNLVDKAFH